MSTQPPDAHAWWKQKAELKLPKPFILSGVGCNKEGRCEIMSDNKNYIPCSMERNPTEEEAKILALLQWGYGTSTSLDVAFTVETIQKAIAEAVAFVREACAKINEEHAKGYRDNLDFGEATALEEAADAIRKRGEE